MELEVDDRLLQFYRGCRLIGEASCQGLLSQFAPALEEVGGEVVAT